MTTNTYIPSVMYVETLVRESGYWTALHLLLTDVMDVPLRVALWLLFITRMRRGYIRRRAATAYTDSTVY